MHLCTTFILLLICKTKIALEPGYDDLSDDDRDIQTNDFDSEYV